MIPLVGLLLEHGSPSLAPPTEVISFPSNVACNLTLHGIVGRVCIRLEADLSQSVCAHIIDDDRVLVHIPSTRLGMDGGSGMVQRQKLTQLCR